MNQDIIDAEVTSSSTQLATTPQPQMQAPALFESEDPEEVLRVASKRAKALMEVVNQQKLFAMIQGKKHLTVEAWQTLAILSGVTPFTEWCRKTENGWEARVTVRNRAGMDIGAAEAQCSRDERTWAKRDDYALASMSQTRATSKAIRSVLAFIAVLAGFEPTPSDEMPGSEDSGAKPPRSERDSATPAASRSDLEPISPPPATQPMPEAPEPPRIAITFKARGSLNALIADQILTPSEIARVVESAVPGKSDFSELEFEDEARKVYKALQEAKRAVSTEIPT